MQSIITSLQEYISKEKEIPSRRKFIQSSGITLSSIQTHFSTWNNLLIEAGYKPKQIKTLWNKDSCIENLFNFVIDNGRLPTAGEYNSKTSYIKPATKTIQKIFGSWNNFILESGFQAKEGLGTPTVAIDGIKYKSINEVLFVNSLLFNKEIYKYEVEYPELSYKYDFHLPELNIYIEIAGLMDKTDYVHRLKEKININDRYNRKLLIVLPKEILKIKNIREHVVNYDFTNRNFK